VISSALRTVARGSEELGVFLARMVGRLPRDRLDQVMRTPARRAIVEAIFWQLPLHLDPRRAAGVDTAIRWRVTTPGVPADVYTLVVSNRRASVVRGLGGPAPRVTITVDAAELLRLATGNSSPMQAYFAGKLTLTGDVMHAARLMALFRPPVRPRG
jgi:alkyl sulfatase BDS1-like metallo-beta-lactamase superfamily hydrolase